MSEASRAWSEQEFGRADLGDVRRTARLVAMGAAACERPCGRVAGVFVNDREREVLRLRFGLGLDREMTLEEIGQQLGITKERVRQLNVRIMAKLRNIAREQNMDPP